MSVDRTYRCNLCHNGEGKSPLHGIYWVNGQTDPYEDPARDRREIATRKPKNESENHLCEWCIRDIARIAAELKGKK